MVWLKDRMLPPSTLVQVIYYIIDENDKFTELYQKTVNADNSMGEEKLIRTMDKLMSTTPQRDQTNLQLNKQKDDLLEIVLDSIGNMSPITDEELEANWTSNAEDFRSKLKASQFIKYLESTYVATMPMRAIGPLQWTRSKQITKREKNYQEACERAEIINELMTSNEVDQEKAERIFKFLTGPFEFKFYTEPQKQELLLVKETNSAEFPLLKTPEGVIEAKQLSLLMAHNGFHTICLEEPDRCMHPQMVERMRDIFQKESIHKDKVVIVISHNPFLINSITAELTHVFFRKSEQMSSKVSCGIRAIHDINRHITDVDNLKKLIFAAKVLCMEGTIDKIVIEGLFDHTFKYSDDDDDENHAILSHQLVVLGSKTFDSPIRQFSEQTSLPAKWVFDRDKYITLDETKTKIANINTRIDPIGNYSQFKDRTIEEFLQDQNGFQKLSEELSHKGIFIWKSGDLEDTIIDSLNPGQQKDIFGEIAPDLTGKTTKEAIEATRKFKKRIKYKLNNIERDTLKDLARDMYKSNEVKRFLEFLRRE